MKTFESEETRGCEGRRISVATSCRWLHCSLYQHLNSQTGKSISEVSCGIIFSRIIIIIFFSIVILISKYSIFPVILRKGRSVYGKNQRCTHQKLHKLLTSISFSHLQMNNRLGYYIGKVAKYDRANVLRWCFSWFRTPILGVDVSQRFSD